MIAIVRDMLGLLVRKPAAARPASAGAPDQAGPDAMAFDTSGLDDRGRKGNEHWWYSPDGDTISTIHCLDPPDFPVSPRRTDEFRSFYSRWAAHNGMAMLAIDVHDLCGALAVTTLSKSPQKPHGMTYAAAISLLFKDQSRVARAVCPERGMTGVRDSAVLARLFAQGAVTVDPATKALVGWMQDPYDPAFRPTLSRNLSEAAEYDAEFPDHPLSRARRFLTRFERSLCLSESAAGALPYG